MRRDPAAEGWQWRLPPPAHPSEAAPAAFFAAGGEDFDDTLFAGSTHDIKLLLGRLRRVGFGPFLSLLPIGPGREWDRLSLGGAEALFAIEAVAAGGGRPSASPRLAALLGLTGTIPEVPLELVDAMVDSIGFAMEQIHAFPERNGVGAEGLDRALASGILMRERVSGLRG
ncbi:MAG: hypothetical protein R3F11_18775 [Verrucomicrobiales bacterium]